MKTTDLFLIDDMPMLVPDGDVRISVENIVSGDSGRDESGELHRFVARRNVQSWDFVYSQLTREEYAYMEKLFAKKDDFQFTFLSATDGTSQTATAFRDKHSVLWLSASKGLFRDYRFRISVC